MGDAARPNCPFLASYRYMFEDEWWNLRVLI